MSINHWAAHRSDAPTRIRRRQNSWRLRRPTGWPAPTYPKNLYRFRAVCQSHLRHKLVDFCLREYVRRIFEQHGRHAKPQTSGGEPFTGEALEIWRAAEAQMREAQSCVAAYDQDQRLGVPRKFVYSSHWEGTDLREVGKVVDSTIEGCVKKVASTGFGHDVHSINIWAYDDAEASKHVACMIQYPHRGWD